MENREKLKKMANLNINKIKNLVKYDNDVMYNTSINGFATKCKIKTVQEGELTDKSECS